MRLLLISDSHGKHDNIEKVLRRRQHLDAVLHMGDVQGGDEVLRYSLDCPLYLVRGNCDWGRWDLPHFEVLSLAGHRIFMCHGHQYDVSYGDLTFLREAAREKSCDIAVFGHIHRPVMNGEDPKVLVLNPGSISLPRQEGHRPSYMMLEIEEGERPRVSLQML